VPRCPPAWSSRGWAACPSQRGWGGDVLGRCTSARGCRRGPGIPAPLTWHPQSPFQGLSVFSTVFGCPLYLGRDRVGVCVGIVLSPPDLPSWGRGRSGSSFVLTFLTPGTPWICPVSGLCSGRGLCTCLLCACLSAETRTEVPLDLSISLWDIKPKLDS